LDFSNPVRKAPDRQSMGNNRAEVNNTEALILENDHVT
jgi:hypothetical protein